MEDNKSKRIQAATLGACFGVAFGVVANIVIGYHIFGIPALAVGLFLGAGIGYFFGEKFTKDFDN